MRTWTPCGRAGGWRMADFLLLTQDACPGCERLKRMLAGPLRGTFDGRIRAVHRQSDPEAFAALTAQYGVQSVPALIRVSDGEQARNVDGLGEVRAFLSR